MPHGARSTAPARQPPARQASSCGQSVLFTFSKCQCSALPSGPRPHVKDCLKVSQSSTRCLFPTPSPPWMETATAPPCPWHLQGVFCSHGHYRLVVHHQLHAAPLGSAMGKPAGGEAGAVRLRHPTRGVHGGDSAPALHVAVLRPAGCRQKCLLSCCAAAPKMLSSFASQPWTLPSLASQPQPGVEPAGAPPRRHSSDCGGRGPGPTTPGLFSRNEGSWVPPSPSTPWEGPVQSVRVINPQVGE